MQAPRSLALLFGALLAHTAHANDAPVPYGIGFDLGPSSGISAVHFQNGSTQNLAKVEGNQQYVNMMLRLTDTDYRPYRFSNAFQEYWRGLKRNMGYPPTDDVVVLEQMISELKHKSESALTQNITQVSIAAPLIKSWDDRVWWESDITDALIRTNLNPSVAYVKGQLYLPESRATMLDSDVETCWLPGRFKFDGKGRPILYINLDEKSLYTEMLHTGCSDLMPRKKESSMAVTIGPDDTFISPQTTNRYFWMDMKLHLYTVAVQYVKWLQESGIGTEDLGTILVTGNGALSLRFRAILNEVTAALPCIASSDEPEYCTLGEKHIDNDGNYWMRPLYAHGGSENAAFAAARGAAKWALVFEEEYKKVTSRQAESQGPDAIP